MNDHDCKSLEEKLHLFSFRHAGRNGHGPTRGKNPPVNYDSCVSKENSRVATAIVAWNFFEAEEKIGIVPDGNSTISNMQVMKEISSSPMAYK